MHNFKLTRQKSYSFFFFVALSSFGLPATV